MLATCYKATEVLIFHNDTSENSKSLYFQRPVTPFYRKVTLYFTSNLAYLVPSF